LKLGPTDLWKLITEYPDIFETHVLLSGYLNDSDIKMFYECCRASRRAVIRAKIELQEKFRVRELSSISTMELASRDAIKRAKIELRSTFRVGELSSISTLELAWEGYPWGERRRFPGGQVFTQDQEYFSSQVAATNDLKLLRWVREEKECDWDSRTSCVAACRGNVDMLKYCCENGCEVHDGTCTLAAEYGNLDCLEYLRSKNCPWNEEVCELAHKNNHMDILTYAVNKKCPGFEAYEQFIPKQ
jgi:hypothetical protein